MEAHSASQPNAASRGESGPALRPFGPGIWIAEGSVVASLGFRYPTRMAVIRLPDGDLFVWSPTALTKALRAEADALGTVRHVIAPNSLHHVFLSEWRSAYPRARLYAPPGLRARRKDIAFDGDLGDAPDPAWAEAIDQVLVRGNAITTEAVFFHRASGAVLFTDLLQSFPPGWFRGWQAVVARLDHLDGNEPQVPQKFRVAFIDRRAARAALTRILAWPAAKVLMAHGTPVEQDAAAFLARAFAWLKAPR
jgi:hypothetical protein